MLDSQPIINKVRDHALRTGRFERVNGQPPASSPGNGITAAVWVDRITPVAQASGLAATSARLAVFVRVFTPAHQQPGDEIDPAVVGAVDELMNAYTGDFTLGGLVRNVDLLGAHGVPLQAQAGYLDIQGQKYRVVTVTVPVILNDVWEQASS